MTTATPKLTVSEIEVGKGWMVHDVDGTALFEIWKRDLGLLFATHYPGQKEPIYAGFKTFSDALDITLKAMDR